MIPLRPAKIFALTCALSLLSACGFTPLHNAATSSNFGDIAIDVTEGVDSGDKEAGFFVLQRLRDRIGHNSGKHILKLDPLLKRDGFGISADDVTTRYDSTLSVRYSLIEASSGDVLTSGDVESTTTYAAPFDPFALDSVDNNALQQNAKDVADRLLLKLASYYANSQ